MSEKNKVLDLLNEAHQEGVISPTSLQALTSCDMGSQIQAGLGVSVDDVESSEVVLLTMMPDDSGSISYSGKEQVVREGHNLVLDALVHSKQRDAILAHTRYLNGHILFPYRSIEQAVRMTTANYHANQGTPLYDQCIILLGSVIAKSQEFAQNGVMARSVTLIITDGADQHSNRAKAKDVASLVKDMTRTETHIVAAMGISDGVTDFRKVFRDMGIEDKWILTPSNHSGDIRKAFQIFSQSAMKASQSAMFHQTALGGFIN